MRVSKILSLKNFSLSWSMVEYGICQRRTPEQVQQSTKKSKRNEEGERDGSHSGRDGCSGC